MASVGRRLLREQASPYSTQLLITRRAIDSWHRGNSSCQCTSSTHSALLKTSNSMGLILVIIMTILHWHNCENCEVVLYSPCYLYDCNKPIFILAVKEGNVSKRSASKDFQVNCGLQPPGKQKKNLIYTFNLIKLSEKLQEDKVQHFRGGISKENSMRLFSY